MTSLLDRPAGRWLLPGLVLLLVLGHVCDVSAFGHHVDAHHGAEGQAGAQLGACDPAPATSTSGQAQPGSVEGTPVARPAPDGSPDRAARAGLDTPIARAHRPPLFLLHAALLI